MGKVLVEFGTWLRRVESERRLGDSGMLRWYAGFADQQADLTERYGEPHNMRAWEALGAYAAAALESVEELERA